MGNPQQGQIVLPNLDMDDVFAMLGDAEVKIKMRDKALEQMRDTLVSMEAERAQLTEDLRQATSGFSEGETQRQIEGMRRQNEELTHMFQRSEKALTEAREQLKSERVTTEAEKPSKEHNIAQSDRKRRS